MPKKGKAVPIWKRDILGMGLHPNPASSHRSPEDQEEVERRIEIYRLRAERGEPLFPFRRDRLS
jgi:hypothetical protein